MANDIILRGPGGPPSGKSDNLWPRFGYAG